MKRTIVLSLILGSFNSLSFAGGIEGVQYTTLTINDASYEVPLANDEYKKDLYWLKKAIKGDKEALEIFLGNDDERIFFIGDTSPRWLIVQKNGEMQVFEP
jgi:hypothetical protein